MKNELVEAKRKWKESLDPRFSNADMDNHWNWDKNKFLDMAGVGKGDGKGMKWEGDGRGGTGNREATGADE